MILVLRKPKSRQNSSVFQLFIPMLKHGAIDNQLNKPVAY